MKNFLRIVKYIHKYRWLAALNILFNILSVVFSLFSIVMLIPFLQLLFDQIPLVYQRPPFALNAVYFLEALKYDLSVLIREQGHSVALLYICGVVAVIFFLKNLFRYLAVRYLAPIRNGIVRDIRNDLYEKILVLPLSYYSKERKGDLIARMTDDVREIEGSIISMIEVTVREPLTILIFLGWMLMMSPILTGFVLIMLLITGGIIGRLGKTLKKQSIEGQAITGFLISIIDETISGLRIIHGFNAEEYRKKQFREVNKKLLTVNNKMLTRRELSSPLTEFLAICVVCCVLWFGGRLVLLHHNLEAATFIGFMAVFSQLIAPAKNFSTAFYNIRKGLASSMRINEVLDAASTICEQPNAKPIQEFKSEIRFKDVSFAYNRFDDKKILDGINLKVTKGKMIALVGQSGAGKTTMADLLPRFYDINNGSIEIDGIDIREYKIADLRNLFGIVSQEPILFNDTVFNNIAFGMPNVTMEAVVNAAIISHAHDFISHLENGYETTIGDRGGKLSGGERQRLTIARAVLRNPPILILDEATSSLDSNSERLVQDALNHLMRGRTTIVIAHRLSTIQYADEIIVMQDGKIAERGNHIALLAHNGMYRKLVELQAF